jgi:glycopeptide antibiotics resistance protein
MLRRHPILALLTVGYLVVVALMTLGPQPVTSTSSHVLFRLLRFFGNHSSTDWITYSRVEFTANIAMFVPLGVLFLLVLGRRRWWLATFIGVALTITIELSQRGIPGRVSDPRDVLANSVGAFIGVLLALLATIPRRVGTPTRPIPVTR